jgi:hypothetical protein
MFHTSIGGMNLFGMFSERLAKRIGYKEFTKIWEL